MGEFAGAIIEIRPFTEMLGPLLIIMAIALAFTVVIEILAGAAFFKGWKQTRMIMLVQFLTNPIMNLGLFWIIWLGEEVFNNYNVDFYILIIAILLEIFVMIAENRIYQRMFKDVSKKRILAFTITANVLSAVLGTIGAGSLIESLSSIVF